MASVIYDSFWDDVLKGNIDCDTDTFKSMLVTSSYSENKKTHTKRSDITSEATGTGYTAGGTTVTGSVTKNTTDDRNDVGLAAVSWPTSTITARKNVIYKSRGGASSADELVACIDFGSDVISSAGTFAIGAHTLRIQN